MKQNLFVLSDVSLSTNLYVGGNTTLSTVTQVTLGSGYKIFWKDITAAGGTLQNSSGFGILLSTGTTWAASVPVEFIGITGTTAGGAWTGPNGVGITALAGPTAVIGTTSTVLSGTEGYPIPERTGLSSFPPSNSNGLVPSPGYSLQKIGNGLEFADFDWYRSALLSTTGGLNTQQILSTSVTTQINPANDAAFYNLYSQFDSFKNFKNTTWNGVIPKNTPVRFYVFNTYTDGVINNNGQLSSFELIGPTYTHNVYKEDCNCNYQYDSYTGYGYGFGATLTGAKDMADFNLAQDIGIFREFNPCPTYGRNKSSFTLSNDFLPEVEGLYTAGSFPYKLSYVGSETGFLMFQYQMYAAPDRVIFRRNDTNAIIFDTTVAGEIRDNPPSTIDSLIQTKSIGIYCVPKADSYDTIKAEIIKYELDDGGGVIKYPGFWNYKIISKPNDLLTNIYMDYLTAFSCIGIPNQTWTTNWIVPITYTRKIRVKFQPNHPDAGATLEQDRLKMSTLFGGTSSVVIDTGPSIATYSQDLILASNVTGVKIEITTDTSNINVTQFKWIFGVANSGVNPF